MIPTPPLAGWTVAITAARRRDEFGAALERHGASVQYGPAIRIVPLADDTQLLEATKRCLAAPLDYLVATTGVGFRGWIDAAETWGLAEPLIDTFAAATILARGPKVRGAVRASDLREDWSPESESSTEVLAHMLTHYDLAGCRVAVQLHGEPLPDLVDTLRGAGADVIEVPVYRWESPADEHPLHQVIEATATASIDCVAFTSAPAAMNFLRSADEHGRGDAVRAALRGPVLCAAVGAVTAAPLRRADIPVVMPRRSRLGALVREIAEQLPPRASIHQVAGRRFELRGQAVLLDDQLISLPPAAMTLLRELTHHRGQVIASDELARLLPSGSREKHAVEAAIGRLRTSLGDPAIVQTVVKRGYRLAIG